MQLLLKMRWMSVYVGTASASRQQRRQRRVDQRHHVGADVGGPSPVAMPRLAFSSAAMALRVRAEHVRERIGARPAAHAHRPFVDRDAQRFEEVADTARPLRCWRRSLAVDVDAAHHRVCRGLRRRSSRRNTSCRSRSSDGARPGRRRRPVMLDQAVDDRRWRGGVRDRRRRHTDRRVRSRLIFWMSAFLRGRLYARSRVSSYELIEARDAVPRVEEGEAATPRRAGVLVIVCVSATRIRRRR